MTGEGSSSPYEVNPSRPRHLSYANELTPPLKGQKQMLQHRHGGCRRFGNRAL